MFSFLISMSPERRENRVTFEEVISKAKETMLRDGKHVPLLIIEGDKTTAIGHIADMPVTHGERVGLLRFLGETTAKGGRIDKLHQVFMVSEGWFSTASDAKPAEMRPSKDPNRKEVLIISCIQVNERKKQIRIFEVLRDDDQTVISLEELLSEEKQKRGSIELPLLEAFVTGFQMAHQSKYN